MEPCFAIISRQFLTKSNPPNGCPHKSYQVIWTLFLLIMFATNWVDILLNVFVSFVSLNAGSCVLLAFWFMFAKMLMINAFFQWTFFQAYLFYYSWSYSLLLWLLAALVNHYQKLHKTIDIGISTFYSWDFEICSGHHYCCLCHTYLLGFTPHSTH